MNGTEQHPVPFIRGLNDLYNNVRHLGYPLARFFTGIILIPHGAQKLFGWFGGNPDGTAAFFAKIGLNPSMGFVILVGITEFFGGIGLAIGFLTRLWAGMIFIAMVNAVFLVHIGNGFFWGKSGYEYPLLLALLALAFFLRGGGEMSVDRKIGKEL